MVMRAHFVEIRALFSSKFVENFAHLTCEISKRSEIAKKIPAEGNEISAKLRGNEKSAKIRAQ